MVKGLLEKLNTESEVVWSVEKIKKIAEKIGLGRYELDLESRAVILSSLEDLYKVMNHTGRTELSNQCRLSMSKFKKKVCLEIGGWQFEAEDSEVYSA